MTAGAGAAAAADAERLARGALARFVAAKFPQQETFARAKLVRALLRSGKQEDAASERALLEASLPACQLFEARFEARLAAIDEAALVGHGDLTKARALAQSARRQPARSTAMRARRASSASREK